MAFSIIQVVLGLLFGLVGIEMSNHPPTNKKQRWTYRIVFAVLGLCVVILTAFQYQDQEKASKGYERTLTELTNSLQDYKAKFENSRMRASMSGELKLKQKEAPDLISAGGARFFVANESGAFLSDGSDPILSFRFNRYAIFISAKIRNEKGELIAEIRDNQWLLNKDIIFDRNYNDSALEVRERSGKVVLQVAVLDGAVYVAGVFNCSNGRSVTIANEDGHAVWSFGATDIKITPIFDYPSDQHLGSCPGYEALRSKHPRITTNGPTGAYMITGPLDICPPQSQQDLAHPDTRPAFKPNRPATSLVFPSSP